MNYQIVEVYRCNLPNAYGVWRKGRTWKVPALAVFETEQEAQAYIASLG